MPTGPIDIKGVVAMIISITFGVLLVGTMVGSIFTGRVLTPETTHTIATIGTEVSVRNSGAPVARIWTLAS